MSTLFPGRLHTGRLSLLVILLCCATSGCSSWGFPGVYRINVEQGNIITQEMVDQIQPGMTRRQVRFILGTPLLEDPFHDERWDYIYMVRNGDRTLREQRLTVYFEGDTLARFTSTLPPTATATTTTGDAGDENQKPADAEAASTSG